MLIKYLSRLIHISIYGFYSSLMINELWLIIFKNFDKNNSLVNFIPKKYNILLGILITISGILNIIILCKENKYLKNKEFKFWKLMLYFKFFCFLMLTPLLDKLILPKHNNDTSNMLNNNISIYTRFLFFVMIILISPYIRFYREKYLVKHKIE